ncbi:MAG: hypothetical protein JXQ75_17935 [Phycisphaerae bacterium]|nr:hypothetical protein [Phycisphaerae bacterium]
MNVTAHQPVQTRLIVLRQTIVAAILAAWTLTAGCVNRRGPDTAVTPDIPVLHIEADAAGNLYVDHQPLTPAQLSERLRVTDDCDLIALHGGLTSSSAPPVSAQTLRTIVRYGMPVLVVEPDDSMTLAGEKGESRPLTVGLSDTQIRGLLQLHESLAAGSPAASNLPSLGATLEMDSSEGVYRFRRVEMGLPGRRVWLVHEQPDETESTTGIQIKKSW